MGCGGKTIGGSCIDGRWRNNYPTINKFKPVHWRSKNRSSCDKRNKRNAPVEKKRNEWGGYKNAAPSALAGNLIKVWCRVESCANRVDTHTSAEVASSLLASIHTGSVVTPLLLRVVLLMAQRQQQRRDHGLHPRPRPGTISPSLAWCTAPRWKARTPAEANTSSCDHCFPGHTKQWHSRGMMHASLTAPPASRKAARTESFFHACRAFIFHLVYKSLHVVVLYFSIVL